MGVYEFRAIHTVVFLLFNFRRDQTGRNGLQLTIENHDGGDQYTRLGNGNSDTGATPRRAKLLFQQERKVRGDVQKARTKEGRVKPI